MPHKQIEDEIAQRFMAAMEVAIDKGGWLGGPARVDDIGMKRGYPLRFDVILNYPMGKVTETKSVSDIIFDSAFARALWGEAPVELANKKAVSAYRFNLARIAVLDDDVQRIVYVVENS